MGRHIYLGLLCRFESSECRTTHPPFSDPRRLVRLLSLVVGILVCYMDCFGDHLPMGYRLATQLIGHNLPRFTTMTP